MAPSIEQVVPQSIQQTAEHVQEKLGAISLGNSSAAVEELKPVEEAPAVQAPAVEAPAAEVPAEESVKPAAVPASSYIRAPLKLSGAIDSWKNFEVTPVIGREYADVDLAAVLKAENSDELLRDLAITSMFPKNMISHSELEMLTDFQSPNAASSFSVPKTTLPTISRRNSHSASASSLASLRPPSCTSTQSQTQEGNTEARMTR